MNIRYGSAGQRLVLAVCLVFAIAFGAAAEKITLQFAFWISAANTAELEAQYELLERYTREVNPNVEVELYYQGWGGYHDKLVTMALADMAPDVMAVSRTYMPNFAEQGIIQPIDPWFYGEPQEMLDDILEIASGTYGGAVYGIPIWGGPIVAEYNADLFEQAGLEEPMFLAQRGEWTWDVFTEFGKKITRDVDGDGTRDVFMHAGLGTAPKDWYVKLRAFGGDVLTEDGQSFTDVGALERGLDFWASLAHEHRLTPVSGEASGLVAGTEAVLFSWVSDVPGHHERVTDFRLELVTPPTGPAGDFTLAGGVPLTVSAATKHPKEAYEFARWYALESGHWQLRGSPVRLTEMAGEYRDYLSTMFSWPEAVVLAMTGKTAMEPGVGKHFTELNSGWNPILSEVAQGLIAPREGAIRIIEHTQTTLNQ